MVFEEHQEFLVPVLGQAGTDDFSCCHVQGREQSRRAVAFVVMRHRCRPALRHRQGRLGAVQRLDGGLFI